MTAAAHSGLTEVFSDVLRQYSRKTGDGSLEYIGLHLKNGNPADWKIYHKFPKTGAAGFAGFRSPLHEQLFRRFSGALPGTEMCDSSYSIANGSGRERAMLQIPMQAEYAQVRAILAEAEEIPALFRSRMLAAADRLNGTLCAPFSTLFQLGAETDADGKLCGMKYYLSIRTDYSVRPEITEQLFDVMTALHPLPDAESGAALYAMMREIGALRYYPSFLGINDDGSNTECKLYFQSALFGSKVKREFAAQNAELAAALSLHALTDEVLRFAAAYPLWAEGIAVSFDEPAHIRLYWREL